MFAAVLKGPAATARARRPRAEVEALRDGRGGQRRRATHGLPRFPRELEARFPFATVRSRTELPVGEAHRMEPVRPGDADASSLPVAALEYTFAHRRRPLDAVFSFHAANFMATQGERAPASARARRVRARQAGSPRSRRTKGRLPVIDYRAAVGDARVRGGWWDPLTWRGRRSAAATAGARRTGGGRAEPGGSAYLSLRSGRAKPRGPAAAGLVRAASDLSPTPARRVQPEGGGRRYRPWYASRFAGIDEVIVRREHDAARARAARSATASTTPRCRPRWWRRSRRTWPS